MHRPERETRLVVMVIDRMEPTRERLDAVLGLTWLDYRTSLTWRGMALPEGG